MQAYGWSLPARYSTEGANGSKGLVSVPVPIYCRPLNISEPGMKVQWPVIQSNDYLNIFSSTEIKQVNDGSGIEIYIPIQILPFPCERIVNWSQLN